MTDPRPFMAPLRTQLRVLGALMMREVITRYGRHNIGFLWLLLEPMVFCLGVVALWNLSHRGADLRLEITPFVVTGYSSMLLWRTCSFRGLNAIEPNRSLLHHRQVKIMDIFISRMLLEVAGVTGAFMLVVAAMTAAGFMRIPRDFFLLTAGWILMAWFSACLGTILGCLNEYSELVERIWHPLSYFMLSISGTFFLVQWLPQGLRPWVLLVPMVHAVEMMRAGYWGESGSFHFDPFYILGACLLMSLIALKLMASKRLRTKG